MTIEELTSDFMAGNVLFAKLYINSFIAMICREAIERGYVVVGFQVINPTKSNGLDIYIASQQRRRAQQRLKRRKVICEHFKGKNEANNAIKEIHKKGFKSAELS